MDIKKEIGPKRPEDDVNEVRRYERISSPAEAAGERRPNRAEASDTMPATFEKTARERQVGFGKKVFWLVGSFLLKALGKGVQAIGKAIESALNITVPLVGFTIPLGEFIAIPFQLFSEWLFTLAEKLMEKVMGYNPADRENPTQEPDDASRGDDGRGRTRDGSRADSEQLPGGSKGPSFDDIIDSEPEAGPDPPGLGLEILQAGQQVVRATAEEAQRREDKELARALKRYDNARVLRRDLNAHKEIAVAWGADPDGFSGDTTASPASSDSPTVAEENGPFEKC
jgi:hypothetical protein